MKVLEAVTQPRRVLGLITLAVCLLLGIAAWAWNTARGFPAGTALFAVGALLAAFAVSTVGKRGWVFLAIAWVLVFVGYGAMPPLPESWTTW